MSSSPVAVILAAGQGSRYRQVAGADQDKLLVPCQGLDGVLRPVLEQVLVNLPAEVTRRVLVTTPERLQVVDLARAYGCQVLLLESSGMGQSLAAAVAECANADGWLVVLGDMPFISPATTRQVIGALTQACISVPLLGDRQGHPVAFGRAYGQALQGLTGDRGARALLAAGMVVEVPVLDLGVVRDVDRPEALIRR